MELKLQPNVIAHSRRSKGHCYVILKVILLRTERKHVSCAIGGDTCTEVTWLLEILVYMWQMGNLLSTIALLTAHNV